MNSPIIAYRANMGVQTTEPFSNTKSLLFDGVDDYVIAPLDGTTTGGILPSNSSDVDLTISIWFNKTTNTSMFQWADRLTSGIPFILIAGTASGYRILINNAYQFDAVISSGTWVNVVIVRNSTTNVWTHYLNGVAIQTYNDGGTLARRLNATDIYLGNGYSSYFNGLIDEVSIWNTDQSANIATLSTAPTVDLTDLNPIAWYRNGDNGAWKSPQWLIPNNENKDKVSNYSLDFDGVDDRVSLASSVNLGINSTVSFWIKRNNVGVAEVFLGENSYTFDYLLYIETTNKLYIRIAGVYGEFGSASVVSIMNDTTNWINIVIVRSGDSIELFLNGVSKGTQTGFGTVTDTMFDTIGGKSSGFVTGGKIDEVSAWNNNTVNPFDIYNGGTPTTIVGASSYWKIGDNSTFLTNWTIPDEVGTSTGTSINMTIEDRVGEAPNSTNNALSINMDEVDRVEDTP